MLDSRSLVELTELDLDWLNPNDDIKLIFLFYIIIINLMKKKLKSKKKSSHSSKPKDRSTSREEAKLPDNT